MRWPSVRRKLPPSSKVLFAVAGALAMLSFLIVRSEVERADRAQAATGPTTVVVMATHDLAAGAAIGPGDVREAEMPVLYLPPAAITSLDQALGAVSSGPVAGGEVLVRTRLGSSVFAPSVPPGHVVVTVGFASVPDGLTTADRVDAFATYAGARPYTAVVGEDLHILAVASNEAGFDSPDATPVTLDVDPETARQLLQAAATGALGLAARASATPSPSPGASPTPSLGIAPG